MAKVKEAIAGFKVGRLTVIEQFEFWCNTRQRTVKRVRCVCECGKEHSCRVDQLGVNVFSCGCFNAENTAAKGRANKTHGMSSSGTYKSWSNMWARCTKEDHPKYPLYKDRTPPDAWKDFSVFFADMGECPPGHSIERKDNSLPYSKENCVWIPKPDQGKNTSRIRLVLFRGEKLSLRETAFKAGVSKGKLDQALYVNKRQLEEIIPGASWL